MFSCGDENKNKNKVKTNEKIQKTYSNPLGPSEPGSPGEPFSPLVPSFPSLPKVHIFPKIANILSNIEILVIQ